MRTLILIALLFAFTTGINANMANASVGDHMHASNQMNYGDNLDNEPCHIEKDHSHDESGCYGCCCIHSHAMVASVTPTKNLFSIKQKNIITSLDSYYSADLSGLKRPPRL